MMQKTAAAPQPTWSIRKRQVVVASSVFLLLVSLLTLLYLKDRQREWRLREEQAAHRLELAYELIARDLERVRSDILFLASQNDIQSFALHKEGSQKECAKIFADFLQTKSAYQQMRLIDQSGKEVLRLNQSKGMVHEVPESELQNKRDRYYVRESLKLSKGELFVSEFDLNLEHGKIEQPLNPVIRFVTPVDSTTPSTDSEVESNKRLLLVANYKGAPLLKDLASISLPGATYLVRNDGQFLLGPNSDDSWGWLLGHNRSISKLFPEAWNKRFTSPACQMTKFGAFSFRRLNPGESNNDNTSQQFQNSLLIVSHLPSNQVFATSNKLLFRLLLLAAVALLPILLLTRYWAKAAFRREKQAALIRASEAKLRELSTTLLKIQEEERQAISREIHDQLGQQATAISLDLKLAMREPNTATIKEHLARSIEETNQLLTRLHDFATRIRPTELDDLGLIDAVESHVWEFSCRAGIEVDLDIELRDRIFPREISENIFRLVQEALNNVLKHANASKVKVKLYVSKDETRIDGEQLILSVQDDGIGLQNKSPSRNGQDDQRVRLGILGMRERVELLQGTFEFASESGSGTTVNANIPLPAR